MNEGKIRRALSKLDPKNGNHWTEDGLPRLEAVRDRVGNVLVEREDITRAAPQFTRDNPVLEAVQAQGEQKSPEESGKQGPPADAAPSSDDAERPAETPIEAARRREAETAQNLNRAKREHDEAVRQLDRLIESGAAGSSLSFAEVRQRYLLSEAQERAARAKKLASEAPSALAPIDRAMARRPGYGHKRPAVGVVPPKTP